MVPKINPTTATDVEVPNTISDQIEQIKKQAEKQLEEEMEKVQLELLEKRQKRLVGYIVLAENKRSFCEKKVF